MNAPVIQKSDEAARAVRAHTTPRMQRLSLLRAYVRGDQYDGRVSWYDKSVPMWEREPCVVWMAPEGAITANEDFLLGEGRYPAVSSRPEEDDGDDDEMLDEDSSKLLDRLIRGIERQADVRAHARQQYCSAQSVGTVVGVFGARAGRLFADTADAEFCTWKLDQNGEATELEIKYPYVDVFRNGQGQWEARCRIFRRVIDQSRDVTYLPAEGRADGIEPRQWAEDPSKTVSHNLGFCPVVVHKFRSVSSIVNEIDGNAIHSRVLDELDAFNMEASVRHEGALFSLPQKYEIGVPTGYNPTDSNSGVDMVPATGSGGRVDPISNPASAHYSNPASGTRARGSRKQGPGYIWQYSDPNTKVGQLEVSGEALQALANTMTDLRTRICEVLAWVPMNPEDIKFASSMSGKALERILARQINRVAKDRDGFGTGYLIKSYCMLLRVAQKTAAGLKTRGLKKALPVLDSFASKETAEDIDPTSGERITRMTWADPPLSLQWGAWFMPMPEDDKALIETVLLALDAKQPLITLRTAVTKLARTFSIEDVNAYLESLESESHERSEREEKSLVDSISKMHAGLNDSDARGRGTDTKSDPRSRSDSIAPAAEETTQDRPARDKSRAS